MAIPRKSVFAERKASDSARAEIEHRRAIDNSKKERRSVSILVQKIGFLRESAIDKTRQRIEELESLRAKAELPVQREILSTQINLHRADLDALTSKPAQLQKRRAKPAY